MKTIRYAVKKAGKNIATKDGNVRLLIIDNSDWLVVWNMFYDFPYIGNNSPS